LSRAKRQILDQIGRTRLGRGLRRVRKPRLLRTMIVGFSRSLLVRRVRAAKPVDVTASSRRRMPAWSMLILLLLSAGVGFYASTIVGQVTGAKGSSAPDFTLGSNPGTLAVPQGQVASFLIVMNSLNGFAGSVSLNVSASPGIVNATYALNPASVSLFTGAGSATLSIPVPASAVVNDYLLTVTAASGRLSHTVILILQVTLPPSPNFQLQPRQSAINVTRGSTGSMAITLTSIGGFSGIVNVTSVISPGGFSSPTLSVTPNRVTLLSGGTASVVITITTSFSTGLATYSITVQGVSGTFSNTGMISLTVQ
jgi:hypothetical protein